MLIAFKILMFVLIFFFGMAALSENDKDKRVHYVSIIMAAICAVCFGFWIG
ncbi:hypothetical protein A33I_07770 [Alkalihalophilus marmarensis DSM 21297]|uniref:Uncharacterized protein n=1 Tax=Alkalihalophilus marmarensis DSM 21297 TaxID=1188261 RepID=U6SRH3_9BACI|nr:hypothetical protein A33I_07770 [Alkalihalophilus marmarensis DSM 21297]